MFSSSVVVFSVPITVAMVEPSEVQHTDGRRVGCHPRSGRAQGRTAWWPTSCGRCVRRRGNNPHYTQLISLRFGAATGRQFTTTNPYFVFSSYDRNTYTYTYTQFLLNPVMATQETAHLHNNKLLDTFTSEYQIVAMFT